MLSALKKYWHHMNGLSGLILFVYILFVCAADAMIFAFDSYSSFFRALLRAFVLTAVFCPILMQVLSKLRIPNLNAKPAKQRCCGAILKLSFYLIPFCVFLLQYIAFYPGSFSPDALDQYAQAVTGRYNDWHPVFQTLFTFTLPLRLTGGWSGSVILFQCICLSATLGYTFNVLYKYSNITVTLISMAFVLLNPYWAVASVSPWKDVSFAIGALLMLTYSLEICFTKGAWIKKPVNTVLYILVAVATTLFRHNALLFTVPLLFAVLFYITPKKGLLICLSVLILCLGIKGPVYTAMDVQSPDKRQIETLGLPMTVIGAVVTYAPESLDEETLEFAYKVAPKEVWEEKYLYGTYNVIKWDDRTDNLVIEEYGAAKVLSMMARAFMASKQVAARGLIRLTRWVFTFRETFSITLPAVSDNPFGILEHDGGLLRALCISCINFVNTHLSYPLFHMGIWHFLLIAATLAKCNLKTFRDWKKIFFVLPVFAYNYGTSLLLTGAEDACRFFLYLFPLIPVYLVFLFRDDSDKDKEISL